MGYLNFPRQLRTALAPWRTANRRAWAQTSCFAGLASAAFNVVGPGEVVERFAHHLGAERDEHGRIEETAALLAETRRALEVHQRVYDDRRRAVNDPAQGTHHAAIRSCG
ncbi:MAG: hypothetical protein Q8S73_12445 [Deltaproteobacteria bacterium]|nr:hypothetical protein [Myxococcales bacterium]MDP3214909.1 hypothetical protein [Deltaproteobacteria bacterium]